MTLQDYLEHYLVWEDMLRYLGIAFIGAFVCIALILIFDGILCACTVKGNKREAYSKISLNTVQRFFDVIFSGGSILSFLSLYYLIDRFLKEPSARAVWDGHKDFWLLLMIIVSVVMNNVVDRVIVPLRRVSREERGGVRVAGMIYVVMIFLYIKYVYENNNYDGFIMYFLGLMVGRFVYFDASFRDFLKTFKGAVMQFPIMIMGLCYTAFMCYMGFGRKYLLISNGVLVSTFFAHIFMSVAVAIIHYSHILLLFTGGSYRSIDDDSSRKEKRPSPKKRKNPAIRRQISQDNIERQKQISENRRNEQ